MSLFEKPVGRPNCIMGGCGCADGGAACVRCGHDRMEHSRRLAMARVVLKNGLVGIRPIKPVVQEGK